MKKLCLLLALMCFTMKNYSQMSAVDYTSDDFAQFKGSKTYVVRTGNKAFDEELANAVKSSWKITPFDFIDGKELDKKITDKSASFILSIIIETGKPEQNYHYLAVMNGGKKKVSSYSYDDMLAYCPINHFVDEEKNTDCAFRVRNMVECMVDAMTIVQKNDIKGNSKKIVDKLREVYNKKSKNIKSRTLLFCQESIGPKLTKSDIAGLYPYRFEVCSKAKLTQVIQDKSTEYYYFQPGITLNKSMIVFDPSNGEVVYLDYQIMGMAINKGNIKDLVEVIKGKD